MSKSSYSQWKALLAITKASLIAIIKHPASLFFSLVFPLVFVWIFGSFKSGSSAAFKVAFSSTTDTSLPVYQLLKNSNLLQIVSYKDTASQKLDLQKGKLAAVLHLQPKQQQPYVNIALYATTATMPEVQQLQALLENMAIKFEQQMNPTHQNFITISQHISEVRPYKAIDFILPGQIGFSILFATLFGISFTFFSLREQLVLKRFYATPVNRLNILIGIGFSRISFQILTVIVLIVVGKLALGFTLANGWLTFFQMLFFSVLLLFVLMGVGLIFSSIAKSDNTIPLYINIFSIPQMLLSGTFFNTSVFPQWMQKATQILPLTHFNMAMRKIAFEGQGLLQCWDNILALGIWLILVYILVYKIFRWE